MSAVSLIDLYDRLANAPDERARAKAITEAFEMLESRYPHLHDLATRQNLSETELRLIKEIEQVRAELKETELRLIKEIEQVRANLKETELKLSKEIVQVRAELKETELKLSKEIEQVRSEVRVVNAQTRADLLKWSFLFWITQFAAILAILWRIWPMTQ